MYLPYTPDAAPDWSGPAKALAIAVFVQGVLAVAILVHGAAGTPLALGAGVIAIVTLPLIVRAQMPMPAKAMLAVATLTATLTVVAATDLLGLRSVERSVAQSAGTGGPAPVVTATSVARPANLMIRGGGDPVAAALADDLAIEMRASMTSADQPLIDGVILNDGSSVALRWAMNRGSTRRRCGDVRVFGDTRMIAVAAFREALDRAIDASRDKPLACA
ncbi:hypothetical protein ASE86_15015 [Sphingomonas sp. Leaf33]|uniref:hypothetical protein n=1 Tax=Sphingomonas sp. Leaf33 TaxID=1736215 RepID=UPI0006F99A3E|nr:hypothetical protein [Sphingomonas sp. Leaf33]KQN20570.1 hypothetical protein ASE86_15015 [Sphingomonas sp. Leaf33]